jgi:hypothetical protein
MSFRKLNVKIDEDNLVPKPKGKISENEFLENLSKVKNLVSNGNNQDAFRCLLTLKPCLEDESLKEHCF